MQLGANPLARHLALGVGLAVYGVWCLATLVALGMSYIPAQIVVHLTAVSFAYPLSALWVFRRAELSWPSFLKFHASYAFQLPIALIVLAIGVDVLNAPLTLSQLAAMGIASVVNFLGLRFVVFD